MEVAGLQGAPLLQEREYLPTALLLPDPGEGEGLGKGEVRGHVSFLQTGNRVWLAPGKAGPGGWASQLLPEVPLLALSFEVRCCGLLLIHPPGMERLLFAEHGGLCGRVLMGGNQGCYSTPGSAPHNGEPLALKAHESEKPHPWLALVTVTAARAGSVLSALRAVLHGAQLTRRSLEGGACIITPPPCPF